MGACQQSLLAEFIKVFADGLRCYSKTCCKIIDEDAARLPGDRQDFLLPKIEKVHGHNI
jgi:hypothetical protein